MQSGGAEVLTHCLSIFIAQLLSIISVHFIDFAYCSIIYFRMDVYYVVSTIHLTPHKLYIQLARLQSLQIDRCVLLCQVIMVVNEILQYTNL